MVSPSGSFSGKSVIFNMFGADSTLATTGLFSVGNKLPPQKETHRFMAIGASSPFQIPQAGYGFSASQGGFSSNSLNGTSSVFMQGMQMMQLALMGQMMQLMQQLMKMVSGGSAMGSAQFGGGASGSGSPAGFLGSSGSGAGTVASGAKDAGGGWVNPVGGKYTKTSNFGPRKAPKAGASWLASTIFSLGRQLEVPTLAKHGSRRRYQLASRRDSWPVRFGNWAL